MKLCAMCMSCESCNDLVKLGDDRGGRIDEFVADGLVVAV